MIYTRHVCQCTDKELADFEWLASEGNTTPRVQLERVRLLAFLYEGDQIISTRALKLPYANYKERIFEQARVQSLSRYRFESGYSYTVPHFRNIGASTLLLKMLIDRSMYGIYATALMHNYSVVSVFLKAGGRLMGCPFRTENGFVALWHLK